MADDQYRIIQLPDGRKAEIPADTTADEERAIMERYAVKNPPAAQQRGAQSPSMTWTDALLRGMRNLPESAWGVVADTADAFMHPIETGKALGKVAGGYALKALPDSVKWEGGDWLPSSDEMRAAADGINRFFADRYGSEDALKRTIATDPAGLLADASTAFTGGAGLMRGAASAGLRGAGRAANVLSKAATLTDPMSIAVKGGDIAARKGIGLNLPQKLYQSALGVNPGFSNSGKARYSPEQIRSMVNTGLENRIPVTHGGWSQADNAISGINGQIDNAISAADKAGLTIDPMDIAGKTLDSDTRNWVANQFDPASDVKAFDDSVEDFLVSHGGEPLSLAKAQELKKGTYRKFESSYRNNAKPMAAGSVEGQKEGARQLRAAINDKVAEGVDKGLIPAPDGGSIHNLNAREAALIDLRDNIERSVLKNGNKGTMDWLTGLLGAIATGDAMTGMGIGAAKQVLTSPGVRSRAAFFADKARRTGNPVRGPLGTAFLGEEAWGEDQARKKQYGGR